MVMDKRAQITGYRVRGMRAPAAHTRMESSASADTYPVLRTLCPVPRDATKRLVLLFLLLLLIPGSALSQDGVGIKPGINFKEIRPPQPVEVGPDRVEVIELLWYDCRTCFAMQPVIERWLDERGKEVVYRRMPAVVGGHMVFFARAFYAAEALGVLDDIHLPLYTAIHRHGRPLNTEDALARFFEEHGVDRTRFLSIFRSSAVAARVREAKVITRRYDARGAPTMVVDGTYRVDPTMVASPAALMEVVDFLVSRELTREE